MLALVVRRLLWIVPVLLTVYTVTFILIKFTPGSPFQSGEKPLPPNVMAELEKKYGLDKPIYEQYVDYLVSAVHGDFGPSYVERARSVADIIKSSFPVSIQLGIVAMLVALAIGIPLGIIAALRQNTWIDYLCVFFALVGISVPSYVLAVLLVVGLGLWLGLVPLGGWDGILSTRIIAPVIALGLMPAAGLARYTRAAMLEVIRQDYIRTARAKGLTELMVNYRHALKNALIPVVTVAGLQFAGVITGSFFVERICNVPGLGRASTEAMLARDYPTVMASVLLWAVVVCLANLAVDLMYGWLDPRVRY